MSTLTPLFIYLSATKRAASIRRTTNCLDGVFVVLGLIRACLLLSVSLDPPYTLLHHIPELRTQLRDRFAVRALEYLLLELISRPSRLDLEWKDRTPYPK